MEAIISKTKSFSAAVLELRKSPRLGQKSGQNSKSKKFKRLSCTSWDDFDLFSSSQLDVFASSSFLVEFYPSESQPPACRPTWRISLCPRVPGKTRKCKIAHKSGSKDHRMFSGKVVCVDSNIVIWGTIKDNKSEGEDYELVLNQCYPGEVIGAKAVRCIGMLRRGGRKSNTEFTITHDAVVFA